MYEIRAGTFHRELAANGKDYNEWWTGKPANHEQLKAELLGLGIAGVRSYGIIGRPNEVSGVHAWDDNAPVGEFQHIDLSEADQQRVRDAIAAHIPKPPERPQYAVTLDTLTAKILSGKVLTEGERNQYIFATAQVLKAQKFF